jgi:hypothetical protein
LLSVQNYFAEYHLEYFRQRRYNHFPAACMPAAIRHAHRCDDLPQQASAARLRQEPGLRPQGAYICSFHDASWLDYLRLPHSLSLAALDEVADTTGRADGRGNRPDLHERALAEPPVIEALYQGALEPVWGHQQSGWLPGFR